MLLLVLFKKIVGKRQSLMSITSELPQAGTETPEQKVTEIQRGDAQELRNRFITEYQPYVAKITSRFCKRYIDPARDDEFNIALIAFDEAINQFSNQKGRSFLGFAETVIRRRLIDYIRKESKFNKQVPYSSFELEDDENHVSNPVEIHQAMDQYEREHIIAARRNEITDFNRKLSQFGISFADLVESSPKHYDTRNTLFEIGRTMAGDEQMMKAIYGKKLLPIKELLAKVEVSRKTLERNRKFLITIAIIYHGPYLYLQDYLHIKPTGKEG
ncbi:MAG TPA: RNA polymerase sigma-I factor [Bacilli bacterium]